MTTSVTTAGTTTYSFNGTFLWYKDGSLLATTTEPVFTHDPDGTEEGDYTVTYYLGSDTTLCGVTSESFWVRCKGEEGKEDFALTNLNQFVDNNELNVSLYPNPTSGHAKIVSDHAVIRRVTVYNLMGQAILDEEVNNTETMLQLKDVAKGMYMVKISTEEGDVMKKIIIE